MSLQPGDTVHVPFTTSQGGNTQQIAAPTAQVLRGETLTALVPTITTLAPGEYITSVTVPDNWVTGDTLSVRLAIVYGGRTLVKTKHAGIVDTRMIDLLEADELYSTNQGKAQKLLKGTDTVLVDKTLATTTTVNVETTLTESSP